MSDKARQILIVNGNELETAVEDIVAYVETGVVNPTATLEPLSAFMARGRAEPCFCRQITCVCEEAKQHEATCYYRRALLAAIGIPCQLHREEVCRACDPCTCETKTV